MIDQDFRDRILAAPEAILEDRDVMNALIGANERLMGSNIVDLRGIAMELSLIHISEPTRPY